MQGGLQEIDFPCTNLFQKCSVDFRNVMYANSAVSRAGAWLNWLYNIYLLVSLLVYFTQSAPASELIPGSRNPGIWASQSRDFRDKNSQ